MSRTIDYDAPRGPIADLDESSVGNLKVGGDLAQSPGVDVDEADAADSFELPGVELFDEELTVTVVPMMSDEFRCARCFLVHHRSQLMRRRDGEDICVECS
ncbi:MAG TPA: DUF4193 domain-containing protein [Planosporangium sp.]|nr:DUF4193 domain-containing protein [Planosporangium sp.]